MKIAPSRTFLLAAVGLMALIAVMGGLFAVLAWALISDLAPEGLAPGLVQAIQIVAGCITTVAVGGAGSMAARDWSSRGLTSSQRVDVAAARRTPPPPPQANQIADDMGDPL